MKHIDNYLEILEVQDELSRLSEADLKQVISKLTPETKTKSLVKQMSTSINKKDPIKSLKNVSRLLKFVPVVEPKKIDSFMKAKSSEYLTLKKMANTILSNSVSGISDKMKEYASSFLAMSSFVSPKDKEIPPKQMLKKNIKDFVIRTRKFMDENEPEETNNRKPMLQKEDIPDLAVAWVIVAMTTAIAAGLVTGVYILTAAVAANLSLILHIIIIMVIVGGVIAVIEAIMEAAVKYG